MVIMTSASGMGDAALRDWLPRLWRRIEDAHYSYLETDDSPEKLQQKKKLEDYIMEYLSLAPHECKFRLTETSKVFHRTVNELPDFNAYRAGLGWAAIARYAANLLNQPWRKEYKVIRLYSGFYKHEVEANLVGAETLLMAMGYRGSAGRLSLTEPPCPDTLAAVSRDALVASCECQIMVDIWEAVVGSGTSGVCWRDVYRERMRYARPATAVSALRAAATAHEQEIYSNLPPPTSMADPAGGRGAARYLSEACPACPEEVPLEAPPVPYLIAPQYVYPELAHCSAVPLVSPYMPYYYPVQPPYMLPTPVYPAVKHAAAVPVNGYPPHYRYPQVPTAQLIELEAPAPAPDAARRPDSRPDSSSRSASSDVTLPSLPRSDTQPALSKAREDGMGTYESWDYVFRNLSSKEQAGERRAPYSPSIGRDSRTLERAERAGRARAAPATLDLEDGLRALRLDSRRETLDRDGKKGRPARRAPPDERRARRAPDAGPHPKADALLTPKVAPDKVKLLSKADIKDRKEVIKQQNSINGTVANTAEVKKVKKPAKLVASELDQSSKSKPIENGTQNKTVSKSTGNSHQNYDLKAQLIVSLDETDSSARPAQQNGERPASRNSSQDKKWECGTCTYLNAGGGVCDMCGKSRRGGPAPLGPGGRECPACTLVNARDAARCDACNTSLDHCPTYI